MKSRNLDRLNVLLLNVTEEIFVLAKTMSLIYTNRKTGEVTGLSCNTITSCLG